MRNVQSGLEMMKVAKQNKGGYKIKSTCLENWEWTKNKTNTGWKGRQPK